MVTTTSKTKPMHEELLIMLGYLAETTLAQLIHWRFSNILVIFLR